jgi:predicted GNAT family N-acyltransferase
MAFVIQVFSTTSSFYSQALQLRYEQLRKPLGLNFTAAELEKDKQDIHFALVVNNEIIACLTLSKCDNGKIKMRQVATKASEQGKGWGAKLSRAAEQYAIENGCATMFCHARKTAVPFYQKMGYKIVSDEFFEVGIPHFVMEKRLL